MDLYEIKECLTQIKDFEIKSMEKDICDPRFIDGASFGMTFMMHRIIDYLNGGKELLIETYDVKLDKNKKI